MNLGRLERVNLRSVWSNEAYDFTPWLASESSLAVLGGVLGLELELEGTEQGVGPYAADIVCKDTVSDRYVLIENQLEKTDHNHLGQLLTYAAGLNALSVVWVASRFVDEHRAALDWLNEVTAEDVHFFGLEIELWRIGDSPVAPKFNVVSKPNDWTKKVAAVTRGESNVSDLKRQQLAFWTQFADYLSEHSDRITPRKSYAQHWATYAIGRSHFWLSADLNSKDGVIQMGMWMDGSDAEAHYHLLRGERSEIEAEVGEPLVWDPKPDSKWYWVGVRWEGEDSTNEALWADQHERMGAVLDRLHAAFSPRVKSLDGSAYSPTLGDDLAAEPVV